MMNYNKKIDANQTEIARALIDAGYSVQSLHAFGGGLPDILVGGICRSSGEMRTWLMEVKTERGKLNQRQLAWRAAWRGQYAVVKTVAEALAVVGIRM